MRGSLFQRILSEEGWRSATLLVCLTATVACGGGGKSEADGPMTGNWQITLQPHGVYAHFIYSGFLTQNGSSVSGAVILGGGCLGVGPVTGTASGENLSLNINEFGQDVSLVGSLPSGNGPVGGQYSTANGACTSPYSSTGTWTAVRIPPLNGALTGVFTSSSTQIHVPPINVTGTLTQGPNTGASTATLSGTMTATSTGSQFCSYLSTATINGVVSGETATLNLYGPNGELITAIPASVSPDGSSLSGTYGFLGISSNCTGDGGTVTLTLK